MLNYELQLAFIKIGQGLSFMICNGDELIQEFNKKNCPGGMVLEYAMMKEKMLLELGSEIKPTIKDYILQCNYNATVRSESELKKDIVVLDIHGWKRMQKELNKK